ncbi:MAG: DNA polymerase I [Bacteroidaceae bacterium]|nr:DNA polymerase I [Bacteroidaceae bacterium]
MKPKLFLLDAYALIYRAYYGLIKNPRINSRGENTSAVFGFIRTLDEVLAKEQPTHIAVAFDPHGGTFRHKRYPDYKAQREQTPEAIRFGVPIIKQLLQAYRIPVIEVEGYEADDVIGTLAAQADAQGIDTYMMTPDKDYGQLVTEHVRMFRPRSMGPGFEVMGPEDVCKKWGIERTEQVVDMLGLMGDASDNIPGCPGVGEKTAATLIQQFGSIENLLQHTDQLKGALQRKVVEGEEQIRLSRWLAEIVRTVPIELDMDALERREADVDALNTIFSDLEMRSLMRKVEDSTVVKPSAQSRPVAKQPSADTQQYLFGEEVEEVASAVVEQAVMNSYDPAVARYHLVDTPEARFQLVCDVLLRAKEVCIDTETTSTESVAAELVGLSFAVKEGEAYYVPVPADRAEAQSIVDEFRCVYESDGICKVGQNMKYDMNVLARYGVELKGELWDTMIAHYVLQPEMRHGMDAMAEAYLGYRTIHIEQLIGERGRGKTQRSMRDVPPAEVCPYAAEDADITLRLKNKFMPMLEAEGSLRLFKEVEMPLMPVLAEMERNGVRIDTDALQLASKEMTEQMNAVGEKIQTYAWDGFNISSPRQIGELLFERLQLVTKPKKTKTGQYVTSEDVLETLRDKHPVVKMILDYRAKKKLISTYLDALPELINPDTGHVHTSFNQTVAATGRLSSSNPNLQNIPVRTEEGREIRRAFVPEPGQLFFSADYSQIELRIMAHLSGDESLIDDFIQGHDIHAATAAKIFHKTIDEVTREERGRAKTANFGIIYGITTFGLAERLGIPRGEAKELIDNYFETYPRVQAYMQESIARAREMGYTETILHRRCYLRDINSVNATVRGYAERNAINAPIQGSAADIIKLAMIRIYKRFHDQHLRSRMILQVHDELNFSVLPEERELVQQIVIDEMQAAYQLRVPLIADCGWGENWLEAH